MSIVLNEQMELRSGWRFAVYVAVFIVALFATGALLSIFIETLPESTFGFLAINAVSLGIPAVGSLMFMVRFVDRTPALAFGVGIHERWASDFGWGAVLAAAMLTILTGFTILTGVSSIESAPDGGFSIRFVGVIAVLIVSAANEELVFRGYPLQVLMTGIGKWPAVVFMSAVFGLLHHLNPNATPLGTLNTFLAGILLCLAYLQTRSLWLPYGIHLGWNVGLGPILGFPLSGVEMPRIWTVQNNGAVWITGGEYGPEAGVVVTGIMIGACIAVGTTKRVSVGPSIVSVLARHPGKVYPEDTALSSLGGS